MTSHLLCCIGLLLAAAPAARAADFAPPGARGTLSVDYVYESIGKKQDQMELHEWRVERRVQITADLAAQPPAPTPQLQPPDAAYLADQQKKLEKAQDMADQMAPMMQKAEQILAACGEDEACIERETMKLGMAMSGTPEMEVAEEAGRGMAELGRTGGPRYQTWRATGQKGTYSIAESEHIVHADPICVTLPGGRCTRDEQRQGSGALSAPPGSGGKGFSGVELDAQKNTLVVQLPAPLTPLAYTETITTDEPDGTHSTPTPRGPQAKQLTFRVAGSEVQPKPITIQLAGGWRNQSGEQVIERTGEGGEGGKLTVRWRFQAQ
jgi:hypothetical protein